MVINQRYICYCFGGGSTPPMPAPAPQQLSGDVQAMADKERELRRAAASNTLLTGPAGVTMPPNMMGKSLLGS